MAQDENKEALITEIKEKLLKKGYSIASWSRKQGYNEAAVKKYMYRYAAKPQLPYSPKVYAILDAIRRDTGIDLMKKAS